MSMWRDLTMQLRSDLMQATGIFDPVRLRLEYDAYHLAQGGHLYLNSGSFSKSDIRKYNRSARIMNILLDLHEPDVSYGFYRFDGSLNLRNLNNGLAQSTYLLDRDTQDRFFNKSGFIRRNDGDYGLVKKAVGDRKLPIYLPKEDVISRKDLVPLANSMENNQFYIDYKDVDDQYLGDIGYHPLTIYADIRTGKPYYRAWDLNDYEISDYNDYNITGGNKFIKRTASKILDNIGSPVVMTSGYQEASPVYEYNVGYNNGNKRQNYSDILYNTKGVNWSNVIHMPVSNEVVITPDVGSYRRYEDIPKDFEKGGHLHHSNDPNEYQKGGYVLQDAGNARYGKHNGLIGWKEKLSAKTMDFLRERAHLGTPAIDLDDFRNHGGTAQATYLLSRPDLEDVFLRHGYIKGTPGDYGFVEEAVNGKDIPIYQTWMKFFMENGIYDLDQMKLEYNSYQVGGHLHQATKSYIFKDPELILTDRYGVKPVVTDNTSYQVPTMTILDKIAFDKAQKEQLKLDLQRQLDARTQVLKADNVSVEDRQKYRNQAEWSQIMNNANEAAANFGYSIGANHPMTVDEVNANTLGAVETLGWMAAPELMGAVTSGYYLATDRPGRAALAAGLSLLPNGRSALKGVESYVADTRNAFRFNTDPINKTAGARMSYPWQIQSTPVSKIVQTTELAPYVFRPSYTSQPSFGIPGNLKALPYYYDGSTPEGMYEFMKNYTEPLLGKYSQEEVNQAVSKANTFFDTYGKDQGVFFREIDPVVRGLNKNDWMLNFEPFRQRTETAWSVAKGEASDLDRVAYKERQKINSDYLSSTSGFDQERIQKQRQIERTFDDKYENEINDYNVKFRDLFDKYYHENLSYEERLSVEKLISNLNLEHQLKMRDLNEERKSQNILIKRDFFKKTQDARDKKNRSEWAVQNAVNNGNRQIRINYDDYVNWMKENMGISDYVPKYYDVRQNFDALRFLGDDTFINDYYGNSVYNLQDLINVVNRRNNGLYSKGGHTIHINPANKGKFNATKKRTGKTTEELTHSKNPLTRRRAIFAQNAARWNHKHQLGSLINTMPAVIAKKASDKYLVDYANNGEVYGYPTIFLLPGYAISPYVNIKEENQPFETDLERDARNNTRRSLFSMYFNVPSEKLNFDPSKYVTESLYRPSGDLHPERKYYTITDKDNNFGPRLDKHVGTYLVSHGSDEKGNYYSVYDEWDIDPFSNLTGNYENGVGGTGSIGNREPVYIYDRVYEKENPYDYNYYKTASGGRDRFYLGQRYGGQHKNKLNGGYLGPKQDNLGYTMPYNVRKWKHRHQLGGFEGNIFDKYNEEKQNYFDTMPIVNEQAGIGRIDIPEVTVTAPDPNIWWTPTQPNPKYPASGALAQDWRTHLAELSIPAMWSGLPALVADAAGTLGSTKGGLYIYHGLNALAPGTAEWASLPAWLKAGTAAADIAFTGTQGAKAVKNPTTENVLYTALGLSPYIAGITNAAKNTNAAKRFGETAKYLWNNGKPFVRNIPYKDSNYYRIVGEDAIKDAEMTGLIRGGKQFPDGPYFSKGKNVWNVDNNDYVIEGTPNIDWINAKRYNGLYLHSNFGEGVINGDNVGIPRGTQGGILLLTGQEPVLTEAMPYYRLTTKVPMNYFTYWLKHPVIGWRLHNFQYRPLTENGVSMFEKIGESNPDKQGVLRSLLKGIGLRKNYNIADPHDYLKIQSERIGEPVSDFYDHMMTRELYDKMTYGKTRGPYEFILSGVHLGETPDEDIIRMSYPYFRLEYPDIPEELADNYTGAHEWIHLINMRRGKRYPMESYDEGVTEIPGIDYSISKLTSKSPKDLEQDKRVIDYFKAFGASEVNARTAQLFNYFGLGKGKKITPDMVKYAKQNYVKDTGYDNLMTEFLSRITDPKAYADWANKNAGKLFSVIGAGGLYLLLKDGEKSSKLNQSGGYIGNVPFDQEGYRKYSMRDYPLMGIIGNNGSVDISTYGMRKDSQRPLFIETDFGDSVILKPNQIASLRGNYAIEHVLQDGGYVDLNKKQYGGLIKPFSYTDIPIVRYLDGGFAMKFDPETESFIGGNLPEVTISAQKPEGVKAADRMMALEKPYTNYMKSELGLPKRVLYTFFDWIPGVNPHNCINTSTYAASNGNETVASNLNFYNDPEKYGYYRVPSDSIHSGDLVQYLDSLNKPYHSGMVIQAPKDLVIIRSSNGNARMNPLRMYRNRNRTTNSGIDGDSLIYYRRFGF